MNSDTLSQTVQLATLASSFAAIASIWIALRVYRRQMNAQLFVAYTQRYEEIMSAFPADARTCRLGASAELPPRSEALTLAVLRYLNLCSEEYYLYRTGHLTRTLWRIWEDELKRTVASALVRREWPDLRCEFVSYPDFLAYVERAQDGVGSRVTPPVGMRPDRAVLPASAPQSDATTVGAPESRRPGA